jgi:hypothetical protein
MITEDSIREALEYGASQAPDPGGVLNDLPVKVRAARRRRAAATAAGTAAVLVAVSAVAATTGLPALGRGEGVATGVSGGGSVYWPSWLPSGFYEMSRSVAPGARGERYERVWSFATSSRTGGPMPYIALSVVEDGQSPLDPLPSPEAQSEVSGIPGHIPALDGVEPDRRYESRNGVGASPSPGSEQVTVKGRAAVREYFGYLCAISWRPTPKQLLTVTAHDTGDNCTVASRFANSLVQGPAAPLTDSITVDRLPSGYAARSRGDVRTTFSGCVAYLNIGPAGSAVDPPAPSPADQIEYGHTPLPAGGTPLTVGGRTARYYERLKLDDVLFQVVAVDLGNGRHLFVKKNGLKPVPKATLAEFAGQISVGAPPTCNWFPSHG